MHLVLRCCTQHMQDLQLARCVHDQATLCAALQVQDKALDVLSQHLKGNAEALQANLRLILHAAEQNALSVRKRALDIIWSCYIGGAAFAATDAGPAHITALLLRSIRLYAGAHHCAKECVIVLSLLQTTSLMLRWKIGSGCNREADDNLP